MNRLPITSQPCVKLVLPCVQLLGNHGPLSEREPHQVFEEPARDCKIPVSI